MEFETDELKKVACLAFEAAKSLYQNDFRGPVDAKDLLAPALYKRLEEANQLGTFGRCVRNKIEINYGIWPIYVLEGEKSNGRRQYEIR